MTVDPADYLAALIGTAARPLKKAPMRRTSAPEVHRGAIVAWVHAGGWQYGLVSGRRGDDWWVRPVDRLDRAFTKPALDLTVCIERDELDRIITSGHGAAAARMEQS